MIVSVLKIWTKYQARPIGGYHVPHVRRSNAAEEGSEGKRPDDQSEDVRTSGFIETCPVVNRLPALGLLVAEW